jgi:hypothetical protein
MPKPSIPSSTPATPYKGPHYGLIKQKIPDWLSTTSLARVSQLNNAVLSRPAWHTSATPDQHQALKTANVEGWRAQNAVDQQLSNVQDAYAFAEPLLKKAIQDKYQLDLDVKTTFLNLYIPKMLPRYAFNIAQGVTSRKVSLLDAALHNFADSETFEDNSCYISQPDYRGHFTIKPLTDAMSIDQFKALCRELDLGARYQQHLNTHLLPTNLTARAKLKKQVTASQKATLMAAVQLACLKTDAQQVPDLGMATYHVLMRALRGERGVMQFYQLSILETALSGILLIAADPDQATSESKVIAYIPHDPENPVKEYNSIPAFMRDLTRKLQANAPIPSRQQQTYQQFFSQFVDHAQRGHFFAGLDQRLCTLQGGQKVPQNDPKLRSSSRRIEGAAIGLWVVARGVTGVFDVLGDDRQLGVFKVVVHGYQLLRAGLGTRTKGYALFQRRLPGIARRGRNLALAWIGKFQQGHTLILRQDNQRLPQQLLIQLNPYRQWHVEKMITEPGRQTLGLGQQVGRRHSAERRRGQGTRTHQKRKRNRDGHHREHERNTLRAKRQDENQASHWGKSAGLNANARRHKGLTGTHTIKVLVLAAPRRTPAPQQRCTPHAGWPKAWQP